MRAETNSTVSAGSMPLRQASPRAGRRQLVRLMSSARRRKAPVLGSKHPRAVEAARGFPEQGQEPSSVREGVHVFDDGVRRHDDGGVHRAFFSMRLSSTAKACFASMPGGTDTARTLPDMRNGRRAGFQAGDGRSSRRRARSPAVQRSSGHAHRRQLLPDHETVYGFFRADRVVDVLPPAVFPAGDG